MKKHWKIIGIIALVLFISGVIVAVSMYNKPHRDIKKANPDFVMSASDLLHDFEDNSLEVGKKYIGKVILVTGEIKMITRTDNNVSVIIADAGDFLGVNCSFNPSENSKIDKLIEGHVIQVKGECKGHIDDVILVDCFLNDINK